MDATTTFCFVHSGDQGDQDDRALRKAVRSRATAYSHRVSSRKGLRYAKYKPLPQEPTPSNPGPQPFVSFSAVAGSCATFPVPFPAVTASFPSTPEAETELARVCQSKDSADSGFLGLSSAGAREPAMCVEETSRQIGPWRTTTENWRTPQDASHGSEESASTRLPNPNVLDATPQDPFQTYPVPYHDWFGPLLDHWYGVVIPRGHRFLKCPVAELERYALWSRNFELTEPALYYTSLFLATGIPVVDGQLHVNKALWLRVRAIKALNEALADPARATSNAIISAVGKIALHEHTYGDREASQLHRAAQQRYVHNVRHVKSLDTNSAQDDRHAWRCRYARSSCHHYQADDLVRQVYGC